MDRWRHITIRLVGIINLLLAVYGFHLLRHAIQLSGALPPKWQSQFVQTKPILYSMFAIDGILLGVLIWGSLLLLGRRRERGVLVCISAYLMEIFCWHMDSLIGGLSLWAKTDYVYKIASSLTVNRVVGLLPIFPQLYTYYPVVAILLLLLVQFSKPPSQSTNDAPIVGNGNSTFQ